MNMENKYIIELEELTVSTADGQMQLYKIKGFNTPTFDSAGVSKLTPYTELDAESLFNKAYDAGMEDGVANMHNECEAAYQKGVNDMYAATRKICLNTEDGALSIDTLSSIFGKASTYAMIRDYQPMEIISKLREYEQEQEKIKVGNEVNGKGGRGIITKIGDDGAHFNVMWENGSTGYYMIEDFKKTGRHFPEIADVLRKMKGEN